MNCKDYKDLLMGFLDNELSEEQSKSLQEHLKTCTECQKELNDFRKLIAITDDMPFVEPEDKVWSQYWGGLYNRLERGIGWILFGIAAIAMLIYGGFLMIEDIITDPALGILCKIGLLALIAGLAVLLVSAARERMHFWRSDRYKDVRR